MPQITMVYKLKADGRPCRACSEVLGLLRRDGYMAQLARTVVADEREPDGEGWELARRHGARSAPFFLVEQDGAQRLYTSYPLLVQNVLQPLRQGRTLPPPCDDAVFDIL